MEGIQRNTGKSGVYRRSFCEQDPPSRLAEAEIIEYHKSEQAFQSQARPTCPGIPQ